VENRTTKTVNMHRLGLLSVFMIFAGLTMVLVPSLAAGADVYSRNDLLPSSSEAFIAPPEVFQAPSAAVGAGVVVSTDSAVLVTGTTATLQGNVISLGSASSVDTFFQWSDAAGKTQGKTSPVKINQPGTFQAGITGLSPGTRYFYVARGSSAELPSGQVRSFMTPLDGQGIPVDFTTTNLQTFMNDQGVFNLDTTVVSWDGNLAVRFSKGVQAKTREGTPLSRLTIENATGLSAVSDIIFASPSYDLQPEGAFFSLSVPCTIGYFPALLPAEIAENKLTVVSWDAGTGKWIDLSCTVDIYKNQVSFSLDHLAPVAVVAHSRPANLALANFKIAQAETPFGQDQLISVDINNSGDLPGSIPLSLMLNGAVEEVRNVTVPGNTSTTVDFSVSPEPGNYSVMLNGFSGEFIVGASTDVASFAVNDLNVSSSEVEEGKGVEVSASISNVSPIGGNYTANLMLDGSVVESQIISLAGGESKQIGFTVYPTAAGSHRIELSGMTQEISVIAPAAVVPDQKSSNVLLIVIIGVLAVGLISFGLIFALRKKNKKPLVQPEFTKLVDNLIEKQSVQPAVDRVVDNLIERPAIQTAVNKVVDDPIEKPLLQPEFDKLVDGLIERQTARLEAVKRGENPVEKLLVPPPVENPVDKIIEIGVQKSWKEIVGHVFRVLEFDRGETTIDKNGKVINPDRARPYGFLLVESPRYQSRLRIPILHRDDFRLAVTAAETLAEDGDQEILVTYVPKEDLPEGIPGFAHAIHYSVTKKNTLERYYDENSPLADIGRQRIFTNLCWEGKLEVEINV
jgi:hypothetical protein